jgi:hypothetical protein
MNIMDILNFNFTEVTIVDIALISISPIAVVVTIVKYRSQISQFILQRFRTIQTLGKNVMTALQAGWRGEIIPKAQPANINQEETPEAPLKPDLHEIREALIAYIDRESRVLKLDDFGGDEYIGYSCGYEDRKIWLTIWIGRSLDIVATRLMFDNEHRNTFRKIEENKNKIEWLFPEEVVDCKSFSGNRQGIGVEKRVDLTQRGNWQTTSVWVRENLEKLLYVIPIHDNIQESGTQKSEDDIPF